MTEAPLWPDVLGRLGRREDLPVALVERAMGSILEGDATDAQIAGFALLLRAKGESVAELAALVRTMLSRGVRVELPDGATPVIDTCGTGGDRSHTINVSTLAALVVAGAGVRVAKHGNRAASSACGSADLLEHLGVVIDLGPTGVARCIEEAGIGFCFAQRFHPCMRFAGPTRKELGVATTFNFLGPLANPARVRHQVLGVSDPEMAERMAGALAELGSARALVFCGDDGLDELTTTTTSTLWAVHGGEIRQTEIDPSALGIAPATTEDLRGGDAAHNADVIRRVVAGEQGRVRDAVVLNAGGALAVYDDPTGEPMTALAAGIDRAAEAIDSGAAQATLDRWIEASSR